MYWEKVFDPAGVTLPTINQLHTELMFDRDDPPWNWENAATRYTYVKRCFPLLSHEFLQALSKWSCSHNTVVDLCCGEGWLAHWLSIYSKSHIQAIDDCSWKFTKYLPEVFKSNAVTYVKTHAGVDAYILSWPMLNEALATQIWDALRPGQELLYIGESHGGCTADDSFFAAVEGHQIEDTWGMEETYRAFFGVHDQPMLFRK